MKKEDLVLFPFKYYGFFFPLLNFVFAVFCISDVSDGSYPDLLPRKPEQILGYWVEAVFCLPGSL